LGLTACAECTAYTLLDRDEITRELLDDVTRAERTKAGYVEDRPEILGAASAYPVNLGAVSVLITELLNWVASYRPLATCSAESWHEGRHQRSDRTNHPEAPDPTCATCAMLLGAGDHADLPRPRAVGHAARILTEARSAILRGFTTVADPSTRRVKWRSVNL
jgi:hypothetical protein